MSTPFFTLRITKNNLTQNKYVFVVSKKVDKRAVVRNRIRRIMKACIKDLNKDLVSGYDMIFIIKHNALDLSHSLMQEQIREAFVKCRIIK
ncbi:MAG: ribonuclease P protein component [bacterium]|nr:ribonuclease P protein component [bacterium]